jgi:trimethylamine:corrinoid methyltransferase-like protein
MKTHEKKKELHEKAIQFIEMIEYSKRRRDSTYEIYRNFSTITSREDMIKTFQKLENWDTMIKRLKDMYNIIIDELCILR